MIIVLRQNINILYIHVQIEFMVGKETQTPICVQMVEQWGTTLIKLIYNHDGI